MIPATPKTNARSSGTASSRTSEGCTVASGPKMRIMMAIIIRPKLSMPARTEGLKIPNARSAMPRISADEGVEDAVGDVVDADRGQHDAHDEERACRGAEQRGEAPVGGDAVGLRHDDRLEVRHNTCPAPSVSISSHRPRSRMDRPRSLDDDVESAH